MSWYGLVPPVGHSAWVFGLGRDPLPVVRSPLATCTPPLPVVRLPLAARKPTRRNPMWLCPRSTMT